MEQVKIKRTKRKKRKITTGEKVLAGVGFASFISGGAGGANKPETRVVASAEASKNSSKAKGLLNRFFGVPEAKAFLPATVPVAAAGSGPLWPIIVGIAATISTIVWLYSRGRDKIRDAKRIEEVMPAIKALVDYYNSNHAISKETEMGFHAETVKHIEELFKEASDKFEREQSLVSQRAYIDAFIHGGTVPGPDGQDVYIAGMDATLNQRLGVYDQELSSMLIYSVGNIRTTFVEGYGNIIAIVDSSGLITHAGSDSGTEVPPSILRALQRTDRLDKYAVYSNENGIQSHVQGFDMVTVKPDNTAVAQNGREVPLQLIDALVQAGGGFQAQGNKEGDKFTDDTRIVHTFKNGQWVADAGQDKRSDADGYVYTSDGFGGWKLKNGQTKTENGKTFISANGDWVSSDQTGLGGGTVSQQRVQQIVAQGNILSYSELTTDEATALTAYLTTRPTALVEQNFSNFKPGSVMAWALSMGTGTSLSDPAKSLGFVRYDSASGFFVKNSQNTTTGSTPVSVAVVSSFSVRNINFPGATDYAVGESIEVNIVGTAGKKIYVSVSKSGTDLGTQEFGTIGSDGRLVKILPVSATDIGQWSEVWKIGDSQNSADQFGTLNFSVISQRVSTTSTTTTTSATSASPSTSVATTLPSVSLPSATVGVGYNMPISGNWTLVSGNNSGISLTTDSSGQFFRGTPLVAGNYTFSLINTQTLANQNYILTVNPAVSVQQSTATGATSSVFSLPSATEGIAYNFVFNSEWPEAFGAIPGMTITENSISGVPSQAGSYTFKLINELGESQNFILVVNAKVTRATEQTVDLTGPISDLTTKINALNSQIDEINRQRSSQSTVASTSDLQNQLNRIRYETMMTQNTTPVNAQTFGRVEGVATPFVGLRMPVEDSSFNGFETQRNGQQEFSQNIQNQPSKNLGQSYIVKKGDTLARIAQKYYGDASLWRKVLAANPGCLSKPGDVKTLKIGYTMVIP